MRAAWDLGACGVAQSRCAGTCLILAGVLLAGLLLTALEDAPAGSVPQANKMSTKSVATNATWNAQRPCASRCSQASSACRLCRRIAARIGGAQPSSAPLGPNAMADQRQRLK